MDREIENATRNYLNHIHKFYNKVNVFLEPLKVVRGTRKFPGKNNTWPHIKKFEYILKQ